MDGWMDAVTYDDTFDTLVVEVVDGRRSWSERSRLGPPRFPAQVAPAPRVIVLARHAIERRFLEAKVLALMNVGHVQVDTVIVAEQQVTRYPFKRPSFRTHFSCKEQFQAIIIKSCLVINMLMDAIVGIDCLSKDWKQPILSLKYASMLPFFT